MSRAVVDSSVLLAVLQKEVSADSFLVADVEVVVSSVNLSEVIGKLILKGASAFGAWNDASRLIDEVVPFSEEQARVAGALIERTRQHGLSLGDRACLALGKVLELPVYTADRAWALIDAGIEVHVIR